MIAKSYDKSFDLPLPAEQFANIRNRYEWLRKTELYRNGRAKKLFETRQCLDRLGEVMSSMTRTVHSMKVNLGFPRELGTEGETRWREYGTTVLRLYQAYAKRNVSLGLKITPRHDQNQLGYSISTMMAQGCTIQDFKNRLGLLLSPDSVKHAADPITVFLETSVSAEEFELNKTQAQDFITLDDIPLVFNYYRQIGDILCREILGRGLTTLCAVADGDGESVIRRNSSDGNRLVVNDIEEIGRLIMDYAVYRFVPDVNRHSSTCISRIPIDFDRPITIEWKDFAELVNSFVMWLKDLGFMPRLRLTGGRGAQVILDISMDRIARNYKTMFPRPLKFDSWVKKAGIAGLISAQATDFVKTLAIAFATHRKQRLGVSCPVTVEIHDLSQRWWNILIDSSRAAVDTGVVGLGSIHHRTGAIRMPVARMPPVFNLESTVSASHYPDTEPVEYQPRYKSPWIQLIGSRPCLLLEPSLSSHDNSFSLVEETFEKYGWIPSQYVRLSSDRFMEKYCWS
jgi:hypothetical protein